MATDSDITADAAWRSLGTLFGLGQAGIDWATVARAVLAFREEERQRWLDRHDELSPRSHRVTAQTAWTRRQLEAGSDAAALFIEVQSGLVGSLLRTGRDWQQLIQDAAPPLKRAIDAYRAELDPPRAEVEPLINQLVMFTQVVGEFMRDQGAQIERELHALQTDVLGREREDHAGRYPKPSSRR